MKQQDDQEEIDRLVARLEAEDHKLDHIIRAIHRMQEHEAWMRRWNKSQRRLAHRGAIVGLALALVVGLLLTACGPTLREELQAMRIPCPYERVLPAADERACEAHRRALIAQHDERPTRWHESLWAFRLLVAEQLEAGRIGRTEATFAVTDYQRRLEVEANQLGAATDAARAAELGNSLTIWRTYFPTPR